MLEQERKRFNERLRQLTLDAAYLRALLPSVVLTYGDLDDGGARLISASPDNDGVTSAEVPEL